MSRPVVTVSRGAQQPSIALTIAHAPGRTFYWMDADAALALADELQRAARVVRGVEAPPPEAPPAVVEDPFARRRRASTRRLL